MANHAGATLNGVREIQFTSEHSIRESALKKAVGGAVKKVCKQTVSEDLREEVYAETCLKLVEFFAKGEPLTGKLSSLAYTIAKRTAIDTFRRPDVYDKLKSWGVEVVEAQPEASAEMQITTPEEQLLAQAETAIKEKILTAGLSTITAADRTALWQGVTRTEPMPRQTPEETRIANAAAQREKRAKNRLTRAVREVDDFGM